VLSVSDLIQGALTTAKHIDYRLKLLAGEWWEYPDQGNQILRMLQASRLTEADAPALSSYLSSYIAETPGVFSIENAETTVTNRSFRYSCTALTGDGKLTVTFSSSDL
jgi:hypothetical protein